MKPIYPQQSEAQRRAGVPIEPFGSQPGSALPGVGSTNRNDALVGALPVFDAMPANSARFVWGDEFDYMSPP